ncbi:TPA: RecX family transcriptional regulator [Photobacterium damselae]
MKKIQPAKTLQNVINSAIYHLNLRDHSISELKTKLEAKTDNQEWVDTVIAQMKGYGYLKEDLPFAIHFCETSYANEYGKRYMIEKLKQKGISEADITEALERVSHQQQRSEYDLVVERLSRIEDFSHTTKEKVFNTLLKRGFSLNDITHAIAEHPAGNTLLEKAVIKGQNANLRNEIIKLAKKLKGAALIRRELSMKHIDVSEFDQIIDELTQSGEIDFYANCITLLAKKRYDLTDYKEKNKAYAYLSSHGFSSDEIKCAFE